MRERRTHKEMGETHHTKRDGQAERIHKEKRREGEGREGNSRERRTQREIEMRSCWRLSTAARPSLSYNSLRERDKERERQRERERERGREGCML